MRLTWRRTQNANTERRTQTLLISSLKEMSTTVRDNSFVDLFCSNTILASLPEWFILEKSRMQSLLPTGMLVQNTNVIRLLAISVCYTYKRHRQRKKKCLSPHCLENHLWYKITFVGLKEVCKVLSSSWMRQDFFVIIF